MTDALYTAGSGAMVQQMRMEMLANNLANVDSPGYKADKALFRSHMTAAQGDGSLTPAPNHHVAFDGTRIDFAAGAMQQTDNALDLAIEGPGFFSVQTPDGVRYTRAGNFSRSREGVMVTQDGHPVLGEGGPIQLGNGKVEIDARGGVSVEGTVVGRISLVAFDNPQNLEKTGDGLFVPMEGGAGERLAENSGVHQGFLEKANVNPVLAMTEMVEVLRAYEAYQKMIRTISDADTKAINDVGRPA